MFLVKSKTPGRQLEGMRSKTVSQSVIMTALHYRIEPVTATVTAAVAVVVMDRRMKAVEV